MEEERIEMAVSLFKEGFNCSQSVVAVFADKYGFTREQALKMSASFGGGCRTSQVGKHNTHLLVMVADKS